jgi:hypothetical protein
LKLKNATNAASASTATIRRPHLELDPIQWSWIEV